MYASCRSFKKFPFAQILANQSWVLTYCPVDFRASVALAEKFTSRRQHGPARGDSNTFMPDGWTEPVQYKVELPERKEIVDALVSTCRGTQGYVVIIKSAPGVVVSVIRLGVANVHAPFL